MALTVANVGASWCAIEERNGFAAATSQLRAHIRRGGSYYLRTIGYKAWIEDASGRQIEETELKKAISHKRLQR